MTLDEAQVLIENALDKNGDKKEGLNQSEFENFIFSGDDVDIDLKNLKPL
jgi:hypothetical protein